MTAAEPPSGREFFVSPAGDDGDTGLSVRNPWATLQHAADLAGPGDIITVMDGEFVESVNVRRSGSAENWITFRAQHRHRAKITHPEGSCFEIGVDGGRVGFIVIEGFDLRAPGVYGKGISSSRGAHHLRVCDNIVHDCGESGISLTDGDYRVVENNITTRNGWRMPACGSGITLWGLQAFDEAPGWHNIVRHNISSANDNGPETRRTDGNGIIIDDFRNVQEGHSGKPRKDVFYEACATLVEGNLCYGNGGRGIQIFLSNNVQVVNNTVFCNNTRQDEDTWRGELSASCSSHVAFVNNLAVTSSDTASNPAAAHNTALFAGARDGDHGGSDCTSFNNLTFDLANPSSGSWRRDGVEIGDFTAGNNLPATDPLLPAQQLCRAGIDLTRLESAFAPPCGSPARLAGDPRHAIAGTDIFGNRRMTAKGQVDLGAVQASPPEESGPHQR